MLLMFQKQTIYLVKLAELSMEHLFLILHEHVCCPYLRLTSTLFHVIFIGHQPLSWTARTQIAMDSARGIEYIHDHTKTCYVHRDIKTSNILLDNGLRAKVSPCKTHQFSGMSAQIFHLFDYLLFNRLQISAWSSSFSVVMKMNVWQLVWLERQATFHQS